ncbi:ribosome biogenesis protein [Planoprotostelium fungivorum]|uniref:Ribosome biogenesis protein n=1 Tax=Planoprotostelium fungivorum TaxID=1890364 RepID=A0A2P6NQH6_9EUKA|nr:ribosome biogenesis protein [Planoprotostelium fungivorum]
MSKRKLREVTALVNSNNETFKHEIEEELIMAEDVEEDFDEDVDDDDDVDDEGVTEEEAKAYLAYLNDKVKAEEKKNNRLQPLRFTSNDDAPKRFFNKQRVLTLATNGIHTRHRHLLNDIQTLLPHCKKESKFDRNDPISSVTEIAELRNCNNVIFFEQTPRDCFMWLSKSPNGPSAKFILSNVHTLDELKMMGNCLKGGRPILVFDDNFESKPHWKVIKELLFQTFGTPKGHPKSMPFIDHVYSFHIADDRIWFRHYQVAEEDPEKRSGEENPTELVEIGPRFILNPIKILSGSFSGGTLFQNHEYLAAVQAERDAKKQRMTGSQKRTGNKQKKGKRKEELTTHAPTYLDNVFEE